MLLVGIDVTITTTDSSFTDCTASFSSVTCVVFHAKMCFTGAVALTTTTSSYINDAYVLYLEATTPHSQFSNAVIYAK